MKSYKELMPQINTFIFDVDGVFTNGKVMVTSSGELLRQMHTRDGYAVKLALKAGFRVAVISGGSNEGVKKRLQNLGIEDIFLGVSDKIEVYHQIVDGYQLVPEKIIYMGDDLPDYPVMKLVGLPVAPQDASPEIKAISKYISHKKGGEGCVRDVIEQVLRVQEKWAQEYKANYD